MPSNLQKHEIQVHNSEKPFACNIKTCKKSFKRADVLDRHNFMVHAEEEKAFPCQFCQKKFRFQWETKIHERRHTGEKPYSCKFCSKMFSTSSAVIGKANLLVLNFMTRWCH